MKIAIIGRGLIGGSLEKAAVRAGHEAATFRGRGPAPALPGFDVVFVATPPSAVERIVSELDAGGTLDDDAVVVDIAGVKGTVCSRLRRFATGRRWHFVGGHPMAGKEKTGYGNSEASLFDGASMILTPFDGTPPEVVARLKPLFESLGFGRVVTTDPATHDTMIAFTSQLCHLMSSAYVREPLAARHGGFSAGSFRDMVRVGAPDPDTWTELFFDNRDALLPVLSRYVGRLEEFRRALEDGDRGRMHRALEEGVAAKAAIDLGKGAQ